MINGAMKLLPPAPDKCQECAVKHAPNEPHDKNSLFYQTWFYMKHGRAPAWTDAYAHCDAETKARWNRELIKGGIDVTKRGVDTSWG